MSLALARERHGDGRRLLATVTDPMAQRKAQKTSERIVIENSFASVAAKWLEHWQEGKSVRHVDSTRRRLAMNILPSLGYRPIAEIEAPEIVAMVRLIESRGARDIAKRAMETAGQVFRYAIAHGFAKRNPATEIRPRDILKATHKVNYARIDARELPNLLRQLEIYQGKYLTRLAVKLMALTFVRTSHVVPLSTQAHEVLSLLRDLSDGSPWLFPGDRSAQKPMSNNTILKALERKGYKGRMTRHGFRGLASTIRHEQGYPHEHIELQLAHTPRNAASAAYNHAHHLKARSKLMKDWADFLEQIQRGARVLLFAGMAWIVGLRGRTLSESGSMATSYASPAPVGAYK